MDAELAPLAVRYNSAPSLRSLDTLPPLMITGDSLSRRKSSICGSSLPVKLFLRLPDALATLLVVSFELVERPRLPFVLVLRLLPRRAYFP